MVSSLFYYQLALCVLVWLFVMLHVTWSQPGLPTPPVPAQPKRPRSQAPKAFEGLTKKPHCALCERGPAPLTPPCPVPPEPMPPTHRRPRTVDKPRHDLRYTSVHFSRPYRSVKGVTLQALLRWFLHFGLRGDRVTRFQSPSFLGRPPPPHS
jgi:hypothetical protein